jgi:enolase
LYRYIGGTTASRVPVPMMNVLNGGAHASNNVDIQEFMIVPHGFASFAESLRAGSEIYYALRDILLERGLSVAVGDEGGFAPDLSGDEEALSLLTKAITRAGYGTDRVGLAIDAAASEWVNDGVYRFPKRGMEMHSSELMEFWTELSREYPLLSMEDPFGEDDFASFSKLTETLGDRMLIVGDDLFVTNADRLRMGIEQESGNAILVKPNHIGTVSEVLRTVALAGRYGYRHILSHRSGETPDDSIADLAVGTSSPLIKTGAPCRGERVAKYNRLLEISLELGENCRFGF